MLKQAVQNNISWCEIVSEMHGATYTAEGNLWGLQSSAPMYYPDIITVNREATTEEVTDFIGNRQIISIKDSYSNLELQSYGFTILFEAEWIYRIPVSIIGTVDSDWRMIETERELSRWNNTSGLDNIIKSDILKREDVKIFLLDKHGHQAGFIANLGAGVVGISNVFSAGTPIEKLWEEIAEVVSTEFPRTPMVGYEHGLELKEALKSGWNSLGYLRVWLKNRS